jgi:hypothetical protein
MLETPRRTALQLRRDAHATALAASTIEQPPRLHDARFCIRVANLNNAITTYDGSDAPNAAPTARISGDRTGLDLPFAIAVDASGVTYVANLEGTADPNGGSITTYARGANANASPLATISGSTTGLRSPGCIAIDGGANIYVANGPFTEPAILIFASGSNGNAAPVRRIAGDATKLYQVNGLAVDATGSIYAVNYGSLAENVVLIFSPGANGNVAPAGIIQGPDTHVFGAMGIAVDGAGKLYVRNTDTNSVTVYAPGATGNAAPIATIGGSATGIIGDGGIAVDPDGTIYVTNAMFGVATVTVYPPGSDGNVSPLLTINGPATQLYEPMAVASGRGAAPGCGIVAASSLALAAGGLAAFAAVRWGRSRASNDAPPANDTPPAGDSSEASHDNSQLN